jgi:Zn-dependent protease with chaperone function
MRVSRSFRLDETTSVGSRRPLKESRVALASNPRLVIDFAWAMTKNRQLSLTVRASLALALMAGFYLLALGVVFVLAWLIYAQIHSGRFSIIGTLLVLVGIYAVLAGIVPRRRRFVPPGPLITAEDQPRFIDEIRSVADATGSAMPHRVYLRSDVNAAVAHIEGFAGTGGETVMQVGLPLIAALTRSELRGVLAHEFGHFSGGDLRLGPLIYRTRQTMSRTIDSLIKRRQTYLYLPFVAYANLYLRATLAISRRQELSADAFAAKVAGGDSMEAGLSKVRAAALAYPVFVKRDLAPLLAARRRPPLCEGFARFLSIPSVSNSLDETVQGVLKEARNTPYDSHPSLAVRIAALHEAPHTPSVTPDPPAIELLSDGAALETEIMSAMLGRDVGTFEPISWDDPVPQAWLDSWREQCRTQSGLLAGLTPRQFPAIAADPGSLASRATSATNDEQRTSALFEAIGRAFAIVLVARGWTIEAPPGEGMRARLQGTDTELEPFNTVWRLRRKQLAPDEWERTCLALGLADVDLGEAAEPAPGGLSDADGSRAMTEIV